MKKTNIIAKGIQYFSDKDYRTIINANLGLYDRLPDDNILLLIKQFAFNLLKNTDINWITFDVDQYIIKTKQYNFKWEDIYK